MRCVLVLCLLGLVSLAFTDTEVQSHGCNYFLGHCYKGCPEGTHPYTTGCGILLPEATCDQPTPVLEERKGKVCDYFACYCDSPSVRDLKTNKCVHLEECPHKVKE